MKGSKYFCLDSENNLWVCRSNDSIRQGQSNNYKTGSSEKGTIPVSTSYSDDYQVLNPHQLYPSHISQGASRTKLAQNFNKSSVYRQETDCRYGVSSFINTVPPFLMLSNHLLRLQQPKASSRYFCNSYSSSNTQVHLSTADNASQRSSLMRMGSKPNNASYNSRLIDHNTSSLRGSLRSVASSPVTNGTDSGPLRLQYKSGSGIRFKSSILPDGMAELDDNFMYSSHRTDSNQNMNRFVSIFPRVFYLILIA